MFYNADVWNFMVKKNIRFKGVDDIKSFAALASEFPFSVELVSGTYSVNAKSLMGIFTLDTMHPVEMNVNSDHADEFLKQAESYIID